MSKRKKKMKRDPLIAGFLSLIIPGFFMIFRHFGVFPSGYGQLQMHMFLQEG